MPTTPNLGLALPTVGGSEDTWGNDYQGAFEDIDAVFAAAGTAVRMNIAGTTAADNAAAGSLGQEINSTIVSGSAVSLTTATGANVTSISLTAGDWDVTFTGQFTGNNSTTVTRLRASISATSATLDSGPGKLGELACVSAALFNTGNPTVHAGPFRVNISSTTTIYGVVQADFATSTCSAYGHLRARRIR